MKRLAIGLLFFGTLSLGHTVFYHALAREALNDTYYVVMTIPWTAPLSIVLLVTGLALMKWGEHAGVRRWTGAALLLAGLCLVVLAINGAAPVELYMDPAELALHDIYYILDDTTAAMPWVGALLAILGSALIARAGSIGQKSPAHSDLCV